MLAGEKVGGQRKARSSSHARQDPHMHPLKVSIARSSLYHPAPPIALSTAAQLIYSTLFATHNLTTHSPIMPQDMPPTGGYEPVQYKRNLPARGFRPATYLLMVGAICTYGFWRVGQGIREQK